MTDQGLSHMHGFSAKVRVRLTDELPDEFREVGIVVFIPPCTGSRKVEYTLKMSFDSTWVSPHFLDVCG